MNSKPFISIITPVWNGIAFLKECIDSVLIQDFEDWEMLISDDGSTDGSREFLNTISDERIKIFEQEKNLGIFGNLNFLFRRVKTEYSFVLCQDDYFTSTVSLSNVIDYWKNAQLDIGFVRFNHGIVSNCLLEKYQKKIITELIDKSRSAAFFLFFGNIPGNLSNVSLRNEIFNVAGYFREDMPYAGDFEFWSRAASFMDIGISKQQITFIRRHENVASNLLNKKGELFSQLYEIYEILIKKTANEFPLKSTITFFNLEIRAAHLRTAIKASLAGNFHFFNAYGNPRSFIIWNRAKQFFLILPIALLPQNLRQRICLAIIRQSLAKWRG